MISDKLLNHCLSPLSMAKIYFEINAKDKQRKLNYQLTKEMPNNGDENLYDTRTKRSYHEHNHGINSKADENTEQEEDDEYLHLRPSIIKITPELFRDMCPTILSQIETGSCQIYKTKTVGFFKNAWIYASVSILIISLCGLSGVALVPLAKSLSFNEILRFLVSVAVGTLCGDALMHLLPHALAPHLDHGNDNMSSASSDGNINDEPVWICSFAFLAALFMYIIETGLPLLTGMVGHGHSHELPDKSESKLQENNIELNDSMNGITKEITVMLDETILDKKTTQLSPVAFMVLIGDGLHNITDGLAIGAAFALDPITGMATAFAVLCHELPHELGDFALLLSTGVSIRKAIFYNLFSSVLSFIGMIAGLVIAQMHTSFVRWIYSATAGSFLYIAFADLIPELNRESKGSFKLMLIQVAGISLGGIIMLLIGLNEDHLRILFE